MKHYIEIQRNTKTFAQFLAQCRAALRKHPAPVYSAPIGWIETIDGAREEMNAIEAGEREKYYNKHRADDERPFDEICAPSATSYQIYLNRKDERSFYNFILEWEDGHGYFYCIDCMAEEQMKAATEPEKEEENKMTYQAIANPAVYHCGNKWVVADEHYKIMSEHSSKEAAEKEAEHLNKLEENTMTTNTAPVDTISENTKTCKSIADDLEAIAEGTLYRCPDCGEQYALEDAEEAEEGSEEWPDVTRYVCPHCGTEIEEPESVSMLDFLGDCYNIEWRLDSNREYKSVQVMVACGGPNIYVDTNTAAVELYWWGDSAKWNIRREAVAAIDEAFEELFNC